VFGLCHVLDFRFAPWIKDLKERKLYATLKPATYSLLEPLIGDTMETAVIVDQWPALMHLKASIQAGAVAPSLILRKLAAAGAGNALSRALRALGRIERTLFTLQGLSDPDLRHHSHAGLQELGRLLRAPLVAMDDPGRPDARTGEQASHGLDVTAPRLAQRALRINLLGHGIAVLDEIELHRARLLVAILPPPACYTTRRDERRRVWR
jgi:hypothetical protein